jgi:hypothetical protein
MILRAIARLNGFEGDPAEAGGAEPADARLAPSRILTRLILVATLTRP